jgi:hypothetical protein
MVSREPRRVTFLLRLTPKERAHLTDVAAALGRSVAWYIRWCCFRRLPASTILEQVKAMVTEAQDANA